jgi:hypothetical protein
MFAVHLKRSDNNGELPEIFGKKDMALTHENYCLKPNEMYNGMHISDIAVSYANALFGLPNDYYTGNHIAFLSSNLAQPIESKDTSTVGNCRVVNINKGSAVLIPVLAAQYHIGSYFKGNKIVSEVGARHAVREHISEAREMWAVSVAGTPPRRKFKPLVDDIRDHYLETNLFRFTVSEMNRLKDTLEIPIQTGDHYAVLGGYFILMKPLDAGIYGIWYGSNGPGKLDSESFYEIIVYDRTDAYPIDISPKKSKR